MTNQPSIQRAYTQWAESYDTDTNRTRDLDQTVSRLVLSALPVHPDRVTLELGCGTGKNTSFLAEMSGEVRAVDFSEGMLAQARQKVVSPRVTFAIADLTQPWPCNDSFADLSVCNLVLEHLSDLDFIFAEAFRCLKTGGRFFVCELHPFRQYQGTQARFQTGDETTLIPAYIHHLSDYFRAASTAGFTLERMDEWWDTQNPKDTEPHGSGELSERPRLVSFLFNK